MKDGIEASKPVYFENVLWAAAETGMRASATLRGTGSPLKKSGTGECVRGGFL